MQVTLGLCRASNHETPPPLRRTPPASSPGPGSSPARRRNTSVKDGRNRPLRQARPRAAREGERYDLAASRFRHHRPPPKRPAPRPHHRVHATRDGHHADAREAGLRPTTPPPWRRSCTSSSGTFADHSPPTHPISTNTRAGLDLVGRLWDPSHRPALRAARLRAGRQSAISSMRFGEGRPVIGPSS